MKTGFTYKGVHTDAMGVTLRSKSRPILPAIRQSLLTLPSLDGTLDYSSANEYGRSMYEDRYFTLTLYMQADNIYALQCKASRLALWLTGSGELIFDDMPDTVWNVSVLSEVDFVPEREGRKALISVSFKAEPFSYAAFDVRDGVTLDSALCIGAMVPLDFTAVTVFNVTGSSDEIEVINYGSAPVRARFIITPSGAAETTGAITLNDIKVGYSFTSAFGAIVIDTEKYTVKQGMVDASGMVTGRFFELQPGKNTVVFAAENVQDYTIEVGYTPRFIYGADWSGAYA